MKTIFTICSVVFIGTLVDIALLHYQANNGKLPFNIKIFPNMGK